MNPKHYESPLMWLAAFVALPMFLTLAGAVIQSRCGKVHNPFKKRRL